MHPLPGIAFAVRRAVVLSQTNFPASFGPARRSQAERRAETERRVLQAATQLIAAHGVRNLSLRDVGRQAGYSRGIVNHHFGTKEDLVKALIVHAQHAFALPATDATGLELLTSPFSATSNICASAAPPDKPSFSYGPRP